jgi:hypothetical protein
MSALPPKADIRQRERRVRFGPEAEVAGCFDKLMAPARQAGP